MIILKNIDIDILKYLANYIVANQKNLARVIDDFGLIKDDNGHGTFFLEPRNSLFKGITVSHKENNIDTVGFGGPNFELSIMDLCLAFCDVYEEYNAYDFNYSYVFYCLSEYDYSIKISTSKKVLNGKEVIENVCICDFEIHILKRIQKLKMSQNSN